MENDVVQYSIDVTGHIGEDKIEEILANAGVDVVGVCWTASWRNEDYYEGKQPYDG